MLQVIATDTRPIELVYVEALDQVWVMCSGGGDGQAMTPVVVRLASEDITHTIVHVQPLHDNFDPVSVTAASDNDFWLHMSHVDTSGLVVSMLANSNVFNMTHLHT